MLINANYSISIMFLYAFHKLQQNYAILISNTIPLKLSHVSWWKRQWRAPISNVEWYQCSCQDGLSRSCSNCRTLHASQMIVSIDIT